MDVACTGVVNSTSPLLVPVFALALQIFVNRERSSQLANEKSIFVSQEMASSSSHNNNISLATLLDWYKIRDTFFGNNCVSRNIPLALEMAAACEHPDAHWLTEMCAGKDVTTIEDAKRFFSALGQKDARALCFLWLCLNSQERRDLAPLRRSTELSFAFAQALLAERTRGEEKLKFAQMAAAQGERDGFAILGFCFRFGEGYEKDLEKANENFLHASELGLVWAMRELGGLLDESDAQRWRWWGRAAALGVSFFFLTSFVNQAELFNSGSGSGVVVFAIGQALQGHVNDQARRIFSRDYDFDSLIGLAKQAIAFYEAQIKATKDAMRAWTLVGIKLKVVKDVRKLIAKLIWDAREKAYKHMSSNVGCLAVNDKDG